jgi:uncharacterized repeat protein (TIGR02543 family)
MDAHNGVTSQKIERRRYSTDDDWYDAEGALIDPDKPKRSAWEKAGLMWTEQELTAISGQSAFTDFFTEKGMGYEYRICSSYWDPTSEKLEQFYSKPTKKVTGTSDNHTPRVGDNTSAVSFDGSTAMLNFVPGLPSPSAHAAGARAIILRFDDGKFESSHIFYNEPLNGVDVRTIDFVHYFNKEAGLKVYYEVAYEQNDRASETHIICYPFFRYKLSGDWESIIIPREAQMAALPGAPQNARLTQITDQSVTIEWDRVGRSQGYYVYSDAVSNGSFAAKIAEVSENRHTHDNLISDTQYYYKVSAHNSAGEGPKSAPIAAKTNASGVTLPGVPQNLTITAITQNSIFLSWDSVAEATGYYVYRNSTKLTIDGETFQDTGLSPNTGYAYWVSAYNSHGEGPAASVTGITDSAGNGGGPLAAPRGLRADPQDDGSIKVAWDPVSGATGYRIYSSTAANGDYYYYSPYWSVEPEYVDREVSPNETWHYRVKAYNDNSESPLSDETASATAKASAIVTYTVSFSAQGGYPEPSSLTVSSGEALGSLPEPYREGYVFDGWHSQPDGGGTRYTAYYPAISGDITLYANWVAILNSIIPLNNNVWTSGLLTGNSANYYSFMALSGTTYSIQWDDLDAGTASYATDIKVSASYDDAFNTEIFAKIDSGYASPEYFTASQTGLIIIKVEGYDYYSAGPYAIRYYEGYSSTTLPAPQRLETTDITHDSITLLWSSVPEALGYYVYRDGILLATMKESTFHNTGLSPDTYYTYKVAAYNSDREGPASEISAVTLSAGNTGETLTVNGYSGAVSVIVTEAMISGAYDEAAITSGLAASGSSANGYSVSLAWIFGKNNSGSYNVLLTTDDGGSRYQNGVSFSDGSATVNYDGMAAIDIQGGGFKTGSLTINGLPGGDSFAVYVLRPERTFQPSTPPRPR